MHRLKISCSSCQKDIDFVNSKESGYDSYWEMFSQLVEVTGQNALKCPYCGNFLWHPLMETINERGIKIGKKEVMKKIERLIF